ncbi:MAG: hypothetical protein QN198_01775 [Armatimonadota bacterium]|nr:hypothetical protein [Armatimonadota bacterium]MDR5702315.1 hypothetical protein [Armatimonadota bacterium]MDR7435372.1 hypothetical protein [Armatimonadota bacterium]
MKRKALVVNIVVLGGLLLLALGLLAIHAVPPKRAPGAKLDLPPVLAGLRLEEVVTGRAAVEEINRLHGRPVISDSGVIAQYGGELGKATVWITRARSPLQATWLLWRMNRRMRRGIQVFSAPQQLEMEGRVVFVTEGLGQKHFYYQSGALILWLAAPPYVADGALRELLRRFP